MPASSAEKRTRARPFWVSAVVSVDPSEKAPPDAVKVTVVPSSAWEPLLKINASTCTCAPTSGFESLTVRVATDHSSGTTVGTGFGTGLSLVHAVRPTSPNSAMQMTNFFIARDPR